MKSFIKKYKYVLGLIPVFLVLVIITLVSVKGNEQNIIPDMPSADLNSAVTFPSSSDTVNVSPSEVALPETASSAISQSTDIPDTVGGTTRVNETNGSVNTVTPESSANNNNPTDSTSSVSEAVNTPPDITPAPTTTDKSNTSSAISSPQNSSADLSVTTPGSIASTASSPATSYPQAKPAAVSTTVSATRAPQNTTVSSATASTVVSKPSAYPIAPTTSAEKPAASATKPAVTSIKPATTSAKPATTATTVRTTTTKGADSQPIKKYDSSCSFVIECKTILDNKDKLRKGLIDYVPTDGTIFCGTVGFDSGESVYDILRRICDENNIQMESSFTPAFGSYYVEGINNLYEFDCGGSSGWMYSVNGAFPNYGCSSYIPENNDKIAFRYTCKLGYDL